MALKVLLYSDYICPWCFIAERSSLRRLEAEYDVDVDWRGFELHPGIPLGGMSLERMFPAPQRWMMQAHLQRAAKEFGVEMKPSADHVPNTRAALAVSEWARDQGRLEAFRDAAMQAWWERGEDLEDPEVIGRLATQAGLDPAGAVGAMTDPAWISRVHAMRDEASSKAVTGIPTFFLGDRRVVGCQPYPVLAAEAERAGAVKRIASGEPEAGGGETP